MITNHFMDYWIDSNDVVKKDKFIREVYADFLSQNSKRIKRESEGKQEVFCNNLEFVTEFCIWMVFKLFMIFALWSKHVEFQV